MLSSYEQIARRIEAAYQWPEGTTVRVFHDSQRLRIAMRIESGDRVFEHFTQPPLTSEELYGDLCAMAGLSYADLTDDNSVTVTTPAPEAGEQFTESSTDGVQVVTPDYQRLT